MLSKYKFYIIGGVLVLGALAVWYFTSQSAKEEDSKKEDSTNEQPTQADAQEAAQQVTDEATSRSSDDASVAKARHIAQG